MTTNETDDKGPAGKFVQVWAESASMVLGQIAGKAFPISVDEAAGPEPAETDVYVTVTAAGAVRGEMSLRVPAATAAALLKIFLGERAAGAELSPDDRAGLEELLRQVAGHVSTSAKAIWQDLPLNLALSPAPTWPAAASGWFRSGADAPAEIAIEWGLSAALNASLSAMQPEQKPSATPAATPPTTPSGAAEPARLGFFMDLELEVTLRFGGRNILLKDILQLGPGSVLELDREIQDPADLLLDGKLIARGEVVMVDGNYGLRVTEVLAGPQLAA